MNKNTNNYFEVIVGTVVLFCAVFFFVSSFKRSQIDKSDSYTIVAKFDNSDGISDGADVKISGVKVGSVTAQSLDDKTFQAKLNLSISKEITLSSDSSAKIASEGLLGSKYIAITPGGDEEALKEGDEIQFTQSSVNLEELLGKFIFNSNSNKEKNEKSN